MKSRQERGEEVGGGEEDVHSHSSWQRSFHNGHQGSQL